jgi:hypothetical protein
VSSRAVCGLLVRGSSPARRTQAAQLSERGDGLALREDGDEDGDGREDAHDRERGGRRLVHHCAKYYGARARCLRPRG